MALYKVYELGLDKILGFGKVVKSGEYVLFGVVGGKKTILLRLFFS